MSESITTEETYHVSNILKHYAHARKKHPYFCDSLDPYGRTAPGHGVTQTLEYVRECNKKSVERGDVGWHNLLDCETWEVFDALSRNDKDQAVEELYDCVAVCLRTIDVLKGWQKLGRPETKGESK